MHYLKHAYTCICMVYRIPAGGQDSRCASMVQQQHTTLKQEITELSLDVYTHGIYKVKLGIYRYVPV